MDADLGDEAFLARLFRLKEFESPEAAVKAFLSWPESEKDVFGRLKRAFASPGAAEPEGNKMLWLAFLTFLRPVGFTAVHFGQLLSQLLEMLGVFVDVSSANKDESILPLLNKICFALLGCAPQTAAEAFVLLRACNVPQILDVPLPKLTSAAAFAQLSLCLIALRSPNVVVLPPSPSLSSLPLATRPDAIAREVKQTGDNAAELRNLVFAKQRQIEVESAKLVKLHKTTKDEKLWLSSKILELEEALRATRGNDELERELEEARSELGRLQQYASEVLKKEKGVFL
jgi:hypothetical protein